MTCSGDSSYKVQLTASAELARKLELARDLMRHSHPGGELGPIVEQALDLLIERLMRRRFGKGKNASAKRTSKRATHGNHEQQSNVTDDRSTMQDTARPATLTQGTAEPDTAEPDTIAPDSTKPATPRTLYGADVQDHHRGELTPSSVSPYIPRSTRRAVVERDGLGCSWVDEHGIRCGSRAWLENDHRHPRAQGGGSEPENLRLLCRRHNRFAAEREYGRKHVEHTIANRRRERAPHAI